MTKVLVLYYSSYGHMEQMADAVAEGARSAGASVDIRRVPETAPAAVVTAAHFKTDSAHEVISGPDALAEYDAIIVGAPTRYGRMASQMAAFLDTTGGLWMRGALNGKVGGAFTSTATQHGGQETTLFSIITNLMHLGLTIVGLDYGFQGQMGVDEVKGGSPYGATTIADGNGSRQPSATELDGARYQGRRIAEVAAKLSA
ncbi:NAD(P)H:quinone oxidoreductase [Sphingomonas sp.]|uniref:NAD(P)H:quinone oxidoreductase n=1 Tax=Sphingomonas sp. TaxID=28214 RepID=UPI001D3D538E|nr:NAD(P)H:quinone oxidoreductase [Sphingomonas sp.]MBX9797324.1 NAD(P)H:quinone oxidoreductase [Sphingomonas sp.]